MALAGLYNVQNVPIFDFSYVKAEFEAVGSPEPKNWDDIYDALKKLKAKYPDSTPLGGRGKELGQNFRQFFEQSFTSGKSGQPAFNDQVVAFDPDKKEWYYGPTAPGFKDSIAFLAKLYKEKLLDNEYLTMDMNALQAKIKDKKVFMIDDYVGGLSGIGDLNPGGVLVPLPMPTFGGNAQILGYTGSHVGDRGTVLSGSLKGDKLDRVLQMLNYMYSDEFYDHLYWNPEVTGEKDGKKYYTNEGMYSGDAAVKDKYLPWSIMGGFQVDNETTTKAGTPYADYKLNVLTAEANKDKYLQQPILPFDTEQSKRLSEIQTTLTDYWNQTIDQFIVGKKSMDDWDGFISDLNGKGAEEEVAIYNEVYKKFFQ
nr:extracellular solute-binding protein [Paenibacillus sacheonensis]